MEEKLIFEDMQPVHDQLIADMKQEMENYSKQIPMSVGGITLTKFVGVKNLKKEEVELLEKNFDDYTKEKLSLAAVLSSFEMKHIILHKSFFASLTQALGLVRKYETDSGFVVGYRPKGLLELNLRKKELKDSVDNRSGGLAGLLIAAVVASAIFGGILSSWVVFGICAALLVGVVLIFGLRWRAQSVNKLAAVSDGIKYYISSRTKNDESKRKLVRELLPELTPVRFEGTKWISENKADIGRWFSLNDKIIDTEKLRKSYINDIIGMGKSEVYLPLGITLPDPPDYVCEAIEKFIEHFPDEILKQSTLCVIADPSALGIKSFNNELEFPPLATEPGIAYEFKDCVVILPETFYHVSPFEKEFLERAQKAAENWNPVEALLEE